MSPAAARVLADALAAIVVALRTEAEKDTPGSPVDPERLLGPDDVGVSRVSWRTAVRAGELRATKIGREFRARRADVDAWIAQRAVSPSQPRSSQRAVVTQDSEDPLARAVARAAARRRRSA